MTTVDPAQPLRRLIDDLRDMGLIADPIMTFADLDRALERLREKILDYDGALDRSGDKWDRLRIEIDREIARIRSGATCLAIQLTGEP